MLHRLLYKKYTCTPFFRIQSFTSKNVQSATDIDLGLLHLEVLPEFYFYFFLHSHRFHLLKIFISEDLRALQTLAGTFSAKLGAWNPPTWPLIHTDNFIFKASETLKGKKYWPPKFMSKKEMWTCTFKLLLLHTPKWWLCILCNRKQLL